MLYKKNNSKTLDEGLFRSPTAEYRAAPFWAWNCELDEKELIRQIECLKEMGFGGFHMHSRSGMATEYLSEEFMSLIKACVKKAKGENMLAWLYDEDRWPSGTAGGYVTKTPRFRQRNLLFTLHQRNDVLTKEKAVEEGGTYLLGRYDIKLNKEGLMIYYKLLGEGEKAEGILRYAYVVTEQPSGWFNGQSYLDTMNPEAVKKFIEITHEAYKCAVGDEFGKTVPAVFTDEPHFAKKEVLSFAESESDVQLPWTPDFYDTYLKKYGIDIIKHLPELFWDMTGGGVSKVRYYYHDHVCERFVSAYVDIYGKWCRENDIYLTGHMWEENKLRRQTAAIGEAMRAYRSFGIPGVDMLCDLREYDTVKQAQSMAHQNGYEGVLSELYGVTNWDFDFRKHKEQGDWMAALGVTVRVQHLSWVSMKGSAKRDYPASLNYQVPWYKEYAYIENHFARLNTAMTRGKAKVNVAVIHPIESYWMNWGPAENTADIRKQLDENFKNVIDWLLFGNIDFDFISESCLPEQCKEIGEKLALGEMAYSAVVVPECITMRKTTLDILKEFQNKGGRVIFMGSEPSYVNAEKSDEIHTLYENSVQIPFEKFKLLTALKEFRDIEIRDEFGESAEQFFYQMREDSDCNWLFIANVLPEKTNEFLCYNDDVRAVNTVIKIKGEYLPTLYDTVSGEIKKIPYKTKNGFTEILYSFYANDSLLLRLNEAKNSRYEENEPLHEVIKSIDFKNKVEVLREEENVCVLDMARFSFDGEMSSEAEEILRIDLNLRKKLGWPLADGQDVQPWVIEKEKNTQFVTLEFSIASEEELLGTHFCAEELEELILNGERVELSDAGYFVDKSIRKYSMPCLKKGENIIIAKVPFGKRISLESCYLTGNFGVCACGCNVKLVKDEKYLAFGNIASQTLPFYGGNLTYKTEVEAIEDCDAVIRASKYAGALIKVYFDGVDVGNIVFEPYTIRIKNVKKGSHTIEFKFFGNRLNTFGAVHNCGKNTWYGPIHWYSEGDSWCYEYNLKPTGILKSPVVQFVKASKNTEGKTL